MKVLNLPFLEIEKLNYDGMPLKEISLKYGVSKPTITKLFKLNNKKMNIRCNRLNIDSDIFKKIDSSDKCYLLGIICSDGSIDKDGYGFQVSSKDLEIPKYVKEILKSNHKICKISSHDKRTNKIYIRHTIHFCSKEICSDLKKMGIYNDKSFTCNMPQIPDRYFWDFFRGLFDGDGCVTGKNGKLKLSIIASSKIMEKIKEKFNIFGISDTKLSILSQRDEDIIYTLKQNSYKDVLFIRDMMYKENTNFKLNRKYEKLKSISSPYKKIMCINKESGDTFIFDNNRDCSNKIKISESMISMILRGKRVSKKWNIHYLN